MISYLALQFRFLLLGLVENLSSKNQKFPVVPSPRLRHRVHGSVDAKGYIDVGRLSWESIKTILAEHNRPAGEFRDILDFGCGSGRVIRNIPISERTSIQGVDIDPVAIRWCQKNLPEYRFTQIAHDPPAPFDRESFDLIFSISVFTHLDEQRQNEWLEELNRLLKPGGILIASVQGDHSRKLRSRQYDMRKGFHFNASERRFFKKDGLPQFYQDTHHTKQYVLQHWSQYFQVMDYVERGIVDYQDAVVLTK